MLLLGIAGSAQAQVAGGCNGSVCTVTTAADDPSTAIAGKTTLRDAINYLNLNYATSPTTVTTINLSQGLGTLTLGANLPLVATSVTIQGNGNTLDGSLNNVATYRGFLVSGIEANGQDAAVTNVTIAGLKIQNVVAQGGNGGSGIVPGGGGLGAGGAVFVGPAANVTLSGVTITNATAVGGNAGASTNAGAGGGGGLGGNGGGGGGGTDGGGGGLLFAGGLGGTAPGGAGAGAGGGGGGGGISSVGAGGTGFNGGNGGAGVPIGNGASLGGGGGGFGNNAPAGQAGGTGAAAGVTSRGGGNGGLGGGGGGNGGNGGFGGGGNGGNGGFGGGGSSGGGGGFAGGLGGSGSFNASGGGGALGGAIFVAGNGTLTITGNSSQASGGVTAGMGANGGGNGLAYGSGIFYQGTNGAPSTLNIGAGTQTIANAIADYSGSGGTNPGGGTNAANQGGSLALTKSGAGTLTLAGANTYSGATTVDGGTLEVDGSIASNNVTVNNGGTLSGTGTVGDPIIAAGGTLSPGNAANPYGTLTIDGPLTFAAGSFYNVNITPTQNSRTNVVGTTTIQGGTVQVAAGAGTYAVRQYTILNATQGVTGQFAGVTSNLAFLMPTLTYDADDVFLNIAPNAGGSVNYTTAAATTNQRAVAYGLNAGEKATGGNNAILNAFNQLTVPQAQAAFDSISGEGIAAAQNTAFGSTALFISSIFDQTTFYGGDGGSANQITLTAPQPGLSAYAPSDGSFARTPIQSDHIRELADLPSRVAPIPAPVFVPQRTWRAWATGFGGVEDFSGNAFPVGSAGQADTIYGGTLGIDYQLMPSYLAGLAIGGSNGEFSVPGRGTSGSTTGGHVAFYDLATFGAFYAASTTSASFYSNQTTRTIAGFGGLGGETERGNFRSNAYSSKVEVGRHFAAYGGLITPFASIELTELRSYGFTETPLSGTGLFALNVQGQDTASVPSLVGARFQTVLPLGNGLVLSPSLQVAWEHQFSPQRPVLAGLINLPGAVFLTNGASPARDSAAVKAGGELAITRQAALFANFDGDFSGVDRFYGGKGGFKYVW